MERDPLRQDVFQLLLRGQKGDAQVVSAIRLPEAGAVDGAETGLF